MQKHKFNIFPEMLPEDYGRLRDDLSVNGYDKSQPIWLFEGAIIDGWNRYKACNELSIQPIYKTFDGSTLEAFDFVMRTNKRRNLNSGQWAAIAVEAEEILQHVRQAIETERKKAISENNKNQYTKQDESAMAQLIAPSQKTEKQQNKEERESRYKIAQMFNTNRTYISDAQKLKEESPELFESVKTGEKTMTEVKAEIKKAEFERKKAEFEKREDTNIILQDNNYAKILHGDCISMLKQLPNNHFDLLLTDPPYGMDFKSGWNNKRKIENDKIIDTINLFNEFLPLCVQKLRTDAHFYIFGNIEFLPQLKPIIEKHLILKNILIWDREIIGMGDLKTYGASYDIIYFGYNKEWRDLNGVRDRDILRFARVQPNSMKHPTEKPQDLLKYLIKKSTNNFGSILDPFAGSGSTLVAAKSLCRYSTGIEIESEYVKIIEQNLAANG